MERRRLPIYALLLANAISLAGEALTALHQKLVGIERTNSLSQNVQIGTPTASPAG